MEDEEYGSDETASSGTHSICSELLSAGQFPGWINIENEIPQEGEEVLVRGFEGQIMQATKDRGYSGGWKQRNCQGWECLSLCETYVTHFARLTIPQPVTSGSR